MSNTLTAIIVDDELDARKNLSYFLQSDCEEVKIVGEASNVADAVRLIKEKRPNIVFLDIEMPKQNGFELFKYFDPVFFSTIFITAYNEYALKAFQVSATDYILKPIDRSLLKTAVKKALIQKESALIKQKLDVLKLNFKAIKTLTIPYKDKHVFINIENIIAIEAQRMYSKVITEKNIEGYIYAKRLNHFENIFENTSNLIRVHRSWIINTNAIISFSKKEQIIYLEKNIQVPLSRTYKVSFKEKLGL